MSSFVISARKYRPQSFSQIQGQSHITTTLQNALKTSQLAQVFLFCGPKGTGKTTCARVLAKAINCEKLTDASEPCNGCKSCENIQKNRSLNLHELDAASNNSVEDIRNLVEQVRYRPPSGKKVFIVDEAHMLSNAAFHGLLKTLEEPPKHVVFIFATTEKYKVIDTILSRCQIFDFHYLTTAQINQQLQHVAKLENMAYEEEALALMSYKAEGSLRDALSTFDLVANFEAHNKLTYQATLRHLNLLDHQYYFKLTDALYLGKAGEALCLYHEIISTSFRGDQFLTGFSEHLRNLLTSQIAGELPLLNPAVKNQTNYKKQAQAIDTAFLHQALQTAHQYAFHYKNVQNKRLHIEVMLLEITKLADQLQVNKTTSLAPADDPKHTPSPAVTPSSKQTSSPASNLHNASNEPKQKTNPSSLAKKSTPEQATTHSEDSPKPLHEAAKTQIHLTQKAIEPHWQAYAQRIEATDPPGYNVMRLPIKVTENKITILLIHPSQKDKVARLTPELKDYIAQKLGHQNFVLETAVQKKEKTADDYTQTEKLQNLIKSNPHVALLQKKLNLEVL